MSNQNEEPAEKKRRLITILLFLLLLAALAAGDLEGVARRLYNVFEDVLPRRYAQVFEIKNRLLELGAMGASMTGSGPTVFGLFRDRESAGRAQEALSRQFPSTFLCQPTGRAV